MTTPEEERVIRLLKETSFDSHPAYEHHDIIWEAINLLQARRHTPTPPRKEGRMADDLCASTLAAALVARADWLDLPRNVEAPRPYISREQFRVAVALLSEHDRQREEIRHLKQILSRSRNLGLFPAGGQLILDVEHVLSDTPEKS